jgi:hypothetical protein
MIIISVMIILIRSLDTIMLQFTYPFLMGSSEGKSLIFFFLMGSLLIIDQFMNNSRFLENSKIYSKKGNYYLKLVIIIALTTYIIGLLLEIWIRSKFGVSIFTTFVSTSPSISTSSIIHSHIFKSMLGVLISDTGIYVPLNIHTGISLAQYVPKFALIIFAVFPVVYFLGLFSIKNRTDYQKIILAFALSTTMIGMVDGGLFSSPSIIGLFGLLIIYSIKNPFSLSNLIKPSTFIILLLIIRVLLGLLGSNPHVYEVTAFGADGNVDLQGYNILNEKTINGKTIINISSDTNELTFLNQTFNRFKGNYPFYFVSWNIYSFF